MDDIMEKLRLLDYENNFCKPYNKPPVSRIYFAYLQGDVAERLQYFYDLCYWLMSFSKAKMVKILPIQEFKDFATHIEMAKKVLTDLKTFGLKLPDNITPKQICNSYGDSVCYIVNDLLNRELIRRDFRFDFPDFTYNAYEEQKQEESSMDDDQENEEGLLFAGKVKLADYLRGGEEEGALESSLYESYRPPTSPKPRIESAKRSMAYTASTLVSENDGGSSSTSSLPVFNSLNAAFIESTIDANDWRKQYERVKNKLIIPENTILEASNEDSGSGGDFGGSGEARIGAIGVEYQDRLTLMKHHLRVLEEFKTGNGISVFEDVADSWGSQLERIRKNEAKLNESSSNQISKLSQVVEEKKTLMRELSTLRDRVKSQIETFDDLTARSEQVQSQLNSKANSIHDHGPLQALKSKIADLRRGLSDSTVRIELSKAVLGRKAFVHEQCPEESPGGDSFYEESFAEFNV